MAERVRTDIYFNPNALKDAKLLSSQEHVALWREVLADWEAEKAKMDLRDKQA
jgi:hypothetical protein